MTKKVRADAISNISHCLAVNRKMERQALIDCVLSTMGYETKDNDPRSPYNATRSLVGTLINDMLSENLILKKGKCYSLAKEEPIVINAEKCRSRILKMLKAKPRTKGEIFENLIKFFGTDKTSTLRDDSMVKSIAGTILADLFRSGDILLEEGVYALTAPMSEDMLKKSLPESRFKELFLDYIHSKGGPFFERFLLNMFEKYFTLTGRNVLACDVTGGSADGGIDIIFETLDDLGFAETVMVQAKCREKMHVTEKEIREFYGAMTALNGSRGMFVTTSTFHEGAVKFLESIPNCVGVDRDKLFELIKKTSYGIVKNQDGYSVDFTVFAK